MNSRSNQTPISIEDCRQYIEEKIFSLSPKAYKQKYPKWPGAVGLEIEMLPIRADSISESNQKPKLVELNGAHSSLATIIKKIAKEKSWTFKEEVDFDSNRLMTIVNLENDDNLTFEPGGQLEFSSKPYPCLNDAVKRVDSIQSLINDRFSEHGITFLQSGINPWYDTSEANLQMPKNRYRAMDTYFTQIGPWGRRMMRLTCTVQVCLDFGASEEIMAKRFLASQLLAPYATSIFSYSPFYANKPSPYLGYRAKVWQNLDQSRTGFPNGLDNILTQMDKASCVDSYLDFLLNSNVVFVESEDFLIPSSPITFKGWLDQPIKNSRPTYDDLVTQLSLLFPEVRPRNFLELRSVDSQSPVWQVVPAAFFTGLLYNDKNLDNIIELLAPTIPKLDDIMSTSVDGLKVESTFNTSKKVMEMAIEGFSQLPSCFLEAGSVEKLSKFYEHFTKNGRTPSDDLLELYYKKGLQEVTLDLYREVEGSWKEL